MFAPSLRRKTKKAWPASEIASATLINVQMGMTLMEEGNVRRRLVALSEAGEDTIPYYLHLTMVRISSDTHAILRNVFNRLNDVIRLFATFLQVFCWSIPISQSSSK
jgi:hypothetical protein